MRHISELQYRHWLHEIAERPKRHHGSSLIYCRCDRSSDVPFLLYRLRIDATKTKILHLHNDREYIHGYIKSLLAWMREENIIDDEHIPEVVAILL